MNTPLFDVVVVGGGPCGSTLAALLARGGKSVCVVEKDDFPRYHIGESLIPQVLDVLEESGALPVVETHGFIRKEGGIFRWGQNTEPWSFHFDETPNRYRHQYAYQVIRSEFDDLLLEHARSLGVFILKDTRALTLSVEGWDNREHGVRTLVRGSDGATKELQSRIVVDCSGQDGWLSSTNGNRQFDRSLMNVAVFTYFTGVDRLSGRDAGAIFCEAIDKGWFWNIPLHDGSNSIGLVVSQPQYNAAHDPKSLFAEAIQRSVHIRRYIANSKRIEDHRVIRDYSYHSNRLHGEGFLIAGDAGNFIDPIWSTGIFLATTSAKFASEALLKWLANGSISELESYSTKVRNLVGVYEDFVKYFYSSDARVEGLFSKAQSLTGNSEIPRDAFIQIISGRIASNMGKLT